MESAGTWFGCVLISGKFDPAEGLEVERPEVIKIGDALSSEDDQIGVVQLSSVVSAFPRCSLIGLWHDLHPLFGIPVQHIQRVKPALVGSAASEYHNSTVDWVVAHG